MLDNVGHEPASAIHVLAEADKARVRWAWSMDRSSREMRPLLSHLDESSVRTDLLDIVRVLSSRTVEVQTDEPSYTMRLANVQMETDRHRSIALQCGATKRTNTVGLQVVEADIAVDGQARDVYGSVSESHPLLREDVLGPLEALHSQYQPSCAVPVELYPSFMSDARAVGIANRYGYVSLPKPAVTLAPRRVKTTVDPLTVPHLYGSHNLELEEDVTTHLHRANLLWAATSGFVPKF
jgi:hypothetical protein